LPWRHRVGFLPSAEQGEKASGDDGGGPSNPQWVGLALRRRLGPSLPSGIAIVFHISGRFVFGPSGRALRMRIPAIASLRLTSSASLHLECGRS
jgi:hypothetical protein